MLYFFLSFSLFPSPSFLFLTDREQAGICGDLLGGFSRPFLPCPQIVLKPPAEGGEGEGRGGEGRGGESLVCVCVSICLCVCVRACVRVVDVSVSMSV
jgi:hypothetical protein